MNQQVLNRQFLPAGLSHIENHICFGGPRALCHDQELMSHMWKGLLQCSLTFRLTIIVGFPTSTRHLGIDLDGVPPTDCGRRRAPTDQERVDEMDQTQLSRPCRTAGGC